MRNLRHATAFLGAAMLVFSGCATSPEDEARQREKEADIASILEQPLPPEFGGTEKCLSSSRVKSHRALDEYHLLFEGSKDRYWVNTLRGRCSALNWGDILIVKHYSGSRFCEFDRFNVADWFDLPRTLNTRGKLGMECTLGTFQPVTADQVAEIDAVLERE